MRKRFSFGSSVNSTSSLKAPAATVTVANKSGGRKLDASPSPSRSAVTASPLVPTTFTDDLPLPSVFVFDLDYTLWPFWVDTHCAPPLKPVVTAATAATSKSGSSSSSSSAAAASSSEVTKLRDRHGEDFGFYDAVPPILWAARQRGITMTIASRTHAPQLADAMLRNLTISPPPGAVATAAASGSATATTTMSTAHSMPPNAFFNRNKDYHYDDTTRSKTASSSTLNVAGGYSSSQRPIKAIALFTAPQIYPGDKVTHFKKIQALLSSPSGGAPAGTPAAAAAGVASGTRRSLLSSSSSAAPSPSPSLLSVSTPPATGTGSGTTSTARKRRSLAILGGSSRNSKVELHQLQQQQQQQQQDTATANTANATGNANPNAIAFEDMIFFDDEARNRNVETDLGVTFVLVRDGLTRDDVDRGVWEWRMRRLGIARATATAGAGASAGNTTTNNNSNSNAPTATGNSSSRSSYVTAAGLDTD